MHSFLPQWHNKAAQSFVFSFDTKPIVVPNNAVWMQTVAPLNKTSICHNCVMRVCHEPNKNRPDGFIPSGLLFYVEPVTGIEPATH